MNKSAAQCLLFAIVHEAVCKDAVKKALLFPPCVEQSFVFDLCFSGFLNLDMQFSCMLMI